MFGTAPIEKNSSSARKYWFVVLFVSAFSIWIRAGIPLTALSFAVHDDLLFVRLGHYLAAGHWLGPYDNLTLAKGPLYSMFIAAAFWASVPLKFAEQLLYLVACGMTAWVARRFAGNVLSLVLFTVLAFNPVLWSPALARVIRQGVYLSVALAVITLIVIIAFPSPVCSHNWRRSAMLGGGLGLTGTAYWLTREEGMWLIPAIVVILAVAFLGVFRPRWSHLPDSENLPSRSIRLKALGVPLAIAIITFTAADFTVAALNYRRYGIFETNEFRAKNFLRAYGALSRIQQDHWRYLITIPAVTWQRAYLVSPAARELAPWLEGPDRERARWIQTTCTYGTIKPCDDVQTGYDMWELRDAVADAGHYTSGAEAMRFYGELADQIDAACAAKEIACLPARSSMQPPFRTEYVKYALNYAKDVTRLVLKMVEAPVGSSPSVGPDDALAIFADMTDNIYVSERATVVLRGWVGAATVTPSLRVESPSADPFESAITPRPAPDVERVYPALKSVRFELKTNCPITNCDLVVDVPGRGQSKFPLTSLLHPGPFSPTGQAGALVGYIDSASGSDSFALRDRRRALQLEIANYIAPVYAYLFPKLAGVATVGLLLATFFRRRFPLPSSLLAFGLASGTAVATYIALMAYVKATADMDVITVLYLSPSSPFVITFTTLGLYSWCIFLKRLKPRWQPPFRIEHILAPE